MDVVDCPIEPERVCHRLFNSRHFLSFEVTCSIITKEPDTNDYKETGLVQDAVRTSVTVSHTLVDYTTHQSTNVVR